MNGWALLIGCTVAACVLVVIWLEHRSDQMDSLAASIRIHSYRDDPYWERDQAKAAKLAAEADYLRRWSAWFAVVVVVLAFVEFAVLAS